MDLISIEEARLVFLVNFHRPTGPVYVPELVVKASQRYSFVKFPTIDDLLKAETQVFAMGRFEDTQIKSLNVYSDGIIVSSAGNTDILERFVADLVQWMDDEFGLVPTPISKSERRFASTLVVRAATDLAKPFRPKKNPLEELNRVLASGRYAPARFQVSGFIGDVRHDASGEPRNLPRFILDRRAGTLPEENLFYSEAPLRTNDHLEVLASLEALAGA